jgi:hypothetical protein
MIAMLPVLPAKSLPKMLLSGLARACCQPITVYVFSVGMTEPLPRLSDLLFCIENSSECFCSWTNYSIDKRMSSFSPGGRPGTTVRVWESECATILRPIKLKEQSWRKYRPQKSLAAFSTIRSRSSLQRAGCPPWICIGRPPVREPCLELMTGNWRRWDVWGKFLAIEIIAGFFIAHQLLQACRSHESKKCR